MNFTKMIKEELCREQYPSACCRLACLSAFLRTSGSIVTRGGVTGFSFSTESPSTSSYIEGIIRHAFDLSPVRSGHEGRTAEYIVPGALGVLVEAGILVSTPEGMGLEMGIDKYIVESECCKRAYIAGAFLGGGSCTVPSEEGGKNTGYHMEFVFSYRETALAFCELLSEFDIAAKLIERKGTFVVYMKSNEEIQEMLSICGAEESALSLAETVVRKDYNNNVNRKLNCDLSNISKQVAASARQTEAIKKIDSAVGIPSLPKELSAVARLRLQDEVLTLGEMAEKLGVTKSCVNHRMRKIMKIASEIKD